MVVGWAMTLGGIFMNIPAPAWGNDVAIDFTGLLAIIYVIVFGTLIAYWLYLEGRTHVSATAASLLTAIEPLTATLLTVLFLNFRLSLIQMGGIVLILGATLILGRLQSTH